MISSIVLIGAIASINGNQQAITQPENQNGNEHTTATRNKRSPNGHLKFLGANSANREERARAGGPFPVMTKSVSNCGAQQISFTPPQFDRTPRIRNGRCAPYGSIPWSVQIQILRNGVYVHHCGAAIIDDQHVLTATHCFGSGMDSSLMKVVVGQHDMAVREEKEMHFEIETVHRHNQYQSLGPYSHDIALVKIKRKGDGRAIRFSDKVSPICLPSPQDNIKDDHKCIISGWGKTEPHGSLQTECLRAANIPILNQATCKKMYNYSSQELLESMVCAGYQQGGVDACKGDSGGPLACKMDDGRYKLVGVVSWGHGCGKANNPGVFTRVTSFLDWINQKQSI